MLMEDDNGIWEREGMQRGVDGVLVIMGMEGLRLMEEREGGGLNGGTKE